VLLGGGFYAVRLAVPGKNLAACDAVFDGWDREQEKGVFRSVDEIAVGAILIIMGQMPE
jgi:hypothetical protein